LLSAADLGDLGLTMLLNRAESLRSAHAARQLPPLLAGRQVALLFEKPSLRTRVTFEAGMAQPNAFATGRNEHHAAVAVTKGLLQIVDDRELRAVLSHEISHVKNHDILIGSIAAGIAMSITFLVRFAFFFGGGGGGGGRDRNNPLGPFVLLASWILAPLAAMMIQLAVTRSREFQADESGAYLSHDPMALASAPPPTTCSSPRSPPVAWPGNMPARTPRRC